MTIQHKFSLLGTVGTAAITGVTVISLIVGTPMATAEPDETTGAQSPSAVTAISPTPVSVQPVGTGVVLPGRVVIATGPDTDRPAETALRAILTARGISVVDGLASGSSAFTSSSDLPRIVLGPATRSDVAAALSGLTPPSGAEAYALRASDKTIALGGTDGSGQFYAVQTLRQLLTGRSGAVRVPGVRITDRPATALRGTIEGFYGQPWTAAERLDQMDFYGQVKANTYIYAPKDDPFHRDRWRDAYPADKLAELGTLIRRAADNHVRFTFAVSPGQSICFSDQADRTALKNKLQAVYDLGARAFSVPFDDISYTKWNCPADETAYGAPGQAAAAKAQVSLLNDIARTWIATHPGAQPLQTVPTEYGDLTDSPYKVGLRTDLDPAVVIMWTGTDVVPPSITVAQATGIKALFGRPVFVWDNYPVNDYGQSSGRLLLAPYDKREIGLPGAIAGLVANPMNQPYASKVAVFGAASFGWNDAGYNARTTWTRALTYLAGGDQNATAAMQVFADLENLAPTFGDTPWQPQAPVLAAQVDTFWSDWSAGRNRQALETFRRYARAIADAPRVIRGGAVQAGFVTDARPWLDATDVWGRALLAALDALAAKADGDAARASASAATATTLATQATAIVVQPARNRWGAAPVKVGDGVLDTFIARAVTTATGR
ncbi:beta-N-acetylglucosaminidase domain-containing protein [Williamsia sp. CHRR-6]|uniref:beta-N-acetylhexosaminidase family protein n=1 Tax=Williamsia sp. CHRR-6 TaxID=2835871 RepID=UPI001BDB5C6E|nr:beta-N-acetylglucosaminidase domain-containing protein [Williamsia sp. CHRR-6]MBT0567900.1 beta-N-acetylglucosaminidase domain-containing protein [Williamsia sp. CHRR-6]